jgi:hypothetical protein
LHLFEYSFGLSKRHAIIVHMLAGYQCRLKQPS